MYEEIISNLEEIIDFIIPSEEEINIVVNKLNNDEALPLLDCLVSNVALTSIFYRPPLL